MHFDEITKHEFLTHLDFENAFLKRYQNEYGFTMPKRLLIVDDIRIRATAKTGIEPKILLNRHRNSDNSNIDVTCVIISNFSFIKSFKYQSF
jgi:hypothetical protein